jgi:uncharacterized protein YcaQ
LRVAGRQNGIRVYQVVSKNTPTAAGIDPHDRLKQLIVLIARILAPVPERSLRGALQHLAHAAPALEGRHSVLTELIRSGELASADVQSLRYLWPQGPLVRKAPPGLVRILAPFDPLVWDRRRFEHFWGWTYRFEAYTPASKRKLGYYAMPLLWSEDVIGWVNIARSDGTGLSVETGFVGNKPDCRAFEKEFEAEIERLRGFLRVTRED